MFSQRTFLSALMSAARSYRVEVVVYLLGVGADPNAKFEDGNSVLTGLWGALLILAILATT